VLADEGAAIVICEYEMEEEGNGKICDAVDKIRLDADYRSDMERKIRGFAKDDVEKRIFDAIIELIESKKK
jgi:UDP-N-acetylglucosamine:LPS N-acetylglucosamine transferase